MIQTLLNFLPGTATMTVLIIAIAGTLIGGALWLAGARYSRSLIALLMVTLGAGIGMKLPEIFHWPIDGWATAAGAAVVLGVLGFVLHRVWVGVGFGIVLACWAALAVWMLCCPQDAGWSWPTASDASTAAATGSILNIEWLKVLWQSLPAEVSRVLPYACGAAMLVGMLSAWVWPRLGVVLLHSSAGASLLLGMGVAAIHFAHPGWAGDLRRFVPSQTGSQVSLLLALIAFGAILQWQPPASNGQKNGDGGDRTGKRTKKFKGAMKNPSHAAGAAGD